MPLAYSSTVNAQPGGAFARHDRPGAIVRLMPPGQLARVDRETSGGLPANPRQRLPRMT